MKYHALFVIFEKATNLKLSSAANVGGALRVNSFLATRNFCRLRIAFANSLDPDKG